MPTDFRIIPYSPPAEKKRKRSATGNVDDGSEYFSPEHNARATSQEQDDDSASDVESDANSLEIGMRPSEELSLPPALLRSSPSTQKQRQPYAPGHPLPSSTGSSTAHRQHQTFTDALRCQDDEHQHPIPRLESDEHAGRAKERLSETGTEVPADLEKLLKSGDLEKAIDYLETFFLQRDTVSKFVWIKELLDMDYSAKEIAQLLQESSVDSPWIYFEPPQATGVKIKEDCHIPSCPHAGRFHRQDTMVSKGFASRKDRYEIKNAVEGLCGLGGVSPSSRDKSQWTGVVEFEKTNQGAARISYSPNPDNTYNIDISEGQKAFLHGLVRVAKVLDNIYHAAGMLQGNQLCCESFSILVRSDDKHYAELIRVPLWRIAELRTASQEVWDLVPYIATSKAKPVTEIIANIGRVAFAVLTDLKLDTKILYRRPSPEWGIFKDYFEAACLVTQVLSIGLMSYVQAHISPLKPFFLDKDIESISLLGAQAPRSLPQILVRPYRMTCMDEMLQRNVLVFEHHAATFSPSFKDRTGLRLNLSATPEDLVDTWGPGCYLTRCLETNDLSSSEIRGIRIGGGTIMASKERGDLYHFYPTTSFWGDEIPGRPTNQSERIMIGAPILVNEYCSNDESMRYRQCDPYLANLGTHPFFWEQSERQLALQGGQYMVAQFAQTWNKTASTTIKKCQLSQQSPLTTSFLESFWGLQVSFCTGIARRVRMRELLADVVGVHVHNQLRVPPEWSQLETQNVLDVLRNEPDLQAWLGQQSEEQQAYLEKVIRQILEKLGPTGIDCTGNLTIAWMRPNKEPRCLRMPCERESAWAKILADSVDCATYAYFTSKCLETDKIHCQGPDAIWHRRSSLLVTAVSPHQDFAGATAVQSTFQLEDRRFYYLGDSNLVRAQEFGPNETRLLFYRTSIGTPIWRRLMQKERHHRIRERQDDDSLARPVLVLTADR